MVADTVGGGVVVSLAEYEGELEEDEPGEMVAVRVGE
jgi:hypothetical protein